MQGKEENRMSENDKLLIELASQSFDSSEVSILEKKAESREAKEILHNRMTTLYHREEASAGLL